jgi:hypothetical protein
MHDTSRPVLSPLRFYDRRGFPVLPGAGVRADSARTTRLAPAHASHRHGARSRDFSPLRCLVALVVALLLSGCSAAAPATDHPMVKLLGTIVDGKGFYVFDLPAPRTFTILFTAGFLVGIVTGGILGIRLAIALLRAADSAAAQYHRSEVARILDASSGVHDVIEDIVRHSRRRIDDLRRQLERVNETKP